MKWAAEREVTIHDVGPTVADTTIQEFIAGAGVVCHGRLEADRVSALLGQCLFGALTYSTAYAAKSSVLGAYCAHGVCPIIFPDPNYPGNSLDGLLHGVNVYDGSRLTQLDFDMAAKVGAGAFDWYLPHNVERHVATIRSLQNGDAFA